MAVKREVLVFRQGENLVYYRNAMPSMSAFWDEHWSSQRDVDHFVEKCRGGYLGRGVVQRTLLQFLPRHGTILEAGCGLGQYVMALRARGYDCRGIDYAGETIVRIKQMCPALPVEQGDILHLPYEDASLDAYISLGVVEHFEAGPDLALIEARRVLKSGGVLILSVPQVFPWRLYEVCPKSEKKLDGMAFYQYAYHPPQLRRLLGNAGFRIVAERGYGSEFALELRFPSFKRLSRKSPHLALIGRMLDFSLFWPLVARMRIFIAKP